MAAAKSVKLKSLIEEFGFSIIYKSTDYENARLYSPDVHRPGLQLAGFYGYFDPRRLIVIGKMEMSFLEPYLPEEKLEKYEMLVSRGIPAIAVCHNDEPDPELIEMAKKYDVTLFNAQHDTSSSIADIIAFLKRELAPSTTMHGVLVELYGLGMLIMGESGVGKSETAIELIKRGHRLVADDAVEIKKINGNTLDGEAPELIRHYVELRGIGIIDVRQLFGFGAVKPHQEIHMIVHLQPWTDGMQYDRMGLNETYDEILDVQVPSVTIPVKPGRNLAVILEVAAMNQRQKYMGMNAAVEFTEQITKHMNAQLEEMNS